MAEQPLLNLSTLIERPALTIDGVRYEMLSPDELSLLDSQRFTIWAGKIDQLSKAPDEAGDGIDELGEVDDAAARKVLVGVPDEIFATLSAANKLAAIEAFTLLLLQKRMAAAGAILPAMLRTGAKPSPGSSASTEARRAGGSEKRPPAS